MSNPLMERCRYCAAEVHYTGGETLVKCTSCGNTLMVAEFRSEQLRWQRAQQENEQNKQKLAEAQQEKEAAQQRLHNAMASLQGILSGQEDANVVLRQLESGQEADRQTLDAMRSLLEGLGAGQQAQQDGLSAVLQALLSSRASAEEKLSSIRDMVSGISRAQNNVAGLLRVQTDLCTRLESAQLDMDALNRVMLGFSNWLHSPARQEDAQRLERISSASGQLLAAQQAASSKLDRLQKQAEETQAAIRSFERRWEQDKLNELSNLFRQAENFQLDREFEQAAAYYRKVVSKGGADAEVYWRLLLCHYCVEYQQNDEKEYIPTILNPDLTAPDMMSIRREMSGSLRTPEQKAYYEKELNRVDRILEKYRQIRDQVQYDVFISVKQSRNDAYTYDSNIASDLYDAIRPLGLRVFNSRRTAIPAGQEFEPYIISALLSARLLIVVGTSAENMNAQWVRNEWLRFQWLQKAERKKTGSTQRRLFCYLAQGMQPREIPRALNPNAEAILDGVQASEKLEATLRQTFPEHFEKTAQASTPSEDIGHLQRQMTVWLRTGRFDLAKAKYDQLIERGQYLGHARLYLYALCVERQVKDIQQLTAASIHLEEETLFILARDMATGRKDCTLLNKLLEENNQNRRQLLSGNDGKAKPSETQRAPTSAPASTQTSAPEAVKNERPQPRAGKQHADDRTVSQSGPGKAAAPVRLSEPKHIKSGSSGNYAYKMYDDGVEQFACIEKYRGKSSKVSIPDTLEGKPVRSIGDEVFEGCKSLTSIDIPGSVTSIGNGAFNGCKSLTSIDIPGSVTSIGNGAFNGCKSLTSIDIPDSVTSIGNGAFNGCKSLTSIHIPDSVTGIGDKAFEACESLTSINIPDSVTSIRHMAFAYCESLTSIHIPDSVTSIGNMAFACCESLTSIHIPDSVTSIEGLAFGGCTSLTSINIPDSVTSIGHGAFQGCQSLTSIHIPDSVTSIEGSAFWGCKSLTSIHIPNNVQKIGDNPFLAIPKLRIDIAPDHPFYSLENDLLIEKATQSAIAYVPETAPESYRIHDGIISIGDGAFSGCTSLTSIHIPDSVTSIGYEAFQGCQSLTSIHIPDSVTSIEDSAFWGCKSLTDIDIPDSVTSIGDSAFLGCESLTSIYIPDSVTSIGGSAFLGCESLTAIHVPNSVTEVGSDAFLNLGETLTLHVAAGSYIKQYAIKHRIPYQVEP